MHSCLHINCDTDEFDIFVSRSVRIHRSDLRRLELTLCATGTQNDVPMSESARLDNDSDDEDYETKEAGSYPLPKIDVKFRSDKVRR